MLRFLIGNISITIGIDSSKIESFIGQSGKFNQHMSIDGSTSWNGIPISEALLTWWDEGTRNSFVNLKPTNYWTDVFGDSGRKDNPNYYLLEKLIDGEINKALSKFGIVENKVPLKITME